MLSRILVLVVLSANAGWAASRNVSKIDLRAFGIGRSIPDEPLDLDELDYQDDVTIRPRNFRPYNGTSRVRMNGSGKLSDEALAFLTGPISTVFIPSVYTLVFLISVPLNILAVVTFTRQIRPKKPAVIYMLNLACADLLFAMLLPLKISYHFSGNNWIYGPNMCRLVTAAFYCNMHCSVLLITCISVDRLLAVVYPIDSLVWRSPCNAAISCVTMWILAIAGSVPLVLSEQTFHYADLGITTCHDIQYTDDLKGHYKIYFLTICCCLFVLPLLITVVSYTRVIWALRIVPRGVEGRSRRKARAVVMALTVMVIFVLCFTPANILLLVHYLQVRGGTVADDTPDGTYAAYLVFMCLGSLNCCLDPMVYYFGSSQCQRQLSSTLRCQKFREILPTSSGSTRSTSGTTLKSSLKNSSKTNSKVPKMDSFQASLSSQYKKLLV